MSLGAKEAPIFAQDLNVEFSKQIDATLDLTQKGMGLRTGRYAMIVNDLKVDYFGRDPNEVQLSSAETVLSKL